MVTKLPDNAYLLIQQCLYHMVGNLGRESSGQNWHLFGLSLEWTSLLLTAPPPPLQVPSDSTDLIQAALIGFPLVFISLSQGHILCLKKRGRS